MWVCLRWQAPLAQLHIFHLSHLLDQLFAFAWLIISLIGSTGISASGSDYCSHIFDSDGGYCFTEFVKS